MSSSHVPQRHGAHIEAPWLGLQPFTEEVRDFFFGRRKERDELFERVTGRPFTLLFGQSGLGKSSLLQAALIPRLRDAGFVPVLVRLLHDDGAPTLEQQVFRALSAATGGRASQAEAAPSLWHLLHDPVYEFCVPGAPRLVLILDQFEEIFTLGRSPSRVRQSEAFLRILSDLVENRAPEAVRAELAEDEEMADRIEYAARPMRLLLSMREDYLHQLERYRAAMPSMMDNRMELRPLNGQQALDATVQPGQLRCKENPTLRPIVSEETGKAIVRFVAGAADDALLDDIDAVPPFFLSLLCEQLNLERVKLSQAQVDAELVSSRGKDILDQYYEDSLEGQPEAVRHLVEDRLVSRGGHRDAMVRDDFLAALLDSNVNEPQRHLDALVARRLLTLEQRGGRVRVELTHDMLTSPVERSREARRERDLLRETKRRQEMRRRVLLGLGAFGAVVVMALWMARKAEEMQRAQRALATAVCTTPKEMSQALCGPRYGKTSPERESCKIPFVSFDPRDQDAYDAVACEFWRKHGIRVERISCSEDGFRDHRKELLTQYPGGVFTWAPGQPIEPIMDAVFFLDPRSWRRATGKTWRPLIRSLKDGEFGGIYSIPFKFYPWAIYFRKSFITKLGPFKYLGQPEPGVWRVPQTWDELITTAEEMRSRNLPAFAFSFGNGSTWTAIGSFDILNLRLHGYEAHEKLMQDALDASEKKAHLEELFKRWAELVPYYAASWKTDTVEDSVNHLLEETAGMYFTGSFFLKYVKEADRNDFGLFSFPRIDTKNDGGLGDGERDAIDAPIDTFVGSATTSKTKLACAKELLMFLGSDEDAFRAYNRENSLYLSVNTNTLEEAAQAESDTPQRQAARLLKDLSAVAGFTDRRVLKLEGQTVTPALRRFLENAYARASTADAVDTLIREISAVSSAN